MALTSVTEGIDFHSLPYPILIASVRQGIKESTADLPFPEPSSSPFVEWTSCLRCGQPRGRMAQHQHHGISEGIKQQLLILQPQDIPRKTWKKPWINLCAIC